LQLAFDIEFIEEGCCAVLLTPLSLLIGRSIAPPQQVAPEPIAYSAQVMQTSSSCEQSWAPHSSWKQSTSRASPPLQLTLSSQMGS